MIVRDETPIDRLMKRCQVGVGGRNALENAHEIMAECYGTLGKLQSALSASQAECERLRDALDNIKSMVVGEAGPRWGTDFSTTTTRMRIADIIDAALAKEPPR